jgi:hypothetical protein
MCTAINTVAVVVWLLLILEWSSWNSPLSDYGSAWGLPALFFLIPLVGVQVWWRRRRRSLPLARGARRYVLASIGFLTVTWVASWVPMIVWLGILSTIASHRWPINLREGPDTTFAKYGFQDHFGLAPERVNDLYYRRGWEFGDGNTHRMRFHFRDPAIIDSIVRALGLKALPEEESTPIWVIESEHPEWWPSQGVSRSARVFQRHSRPRLWVDDETSTAYYRSWP